MARRRCLSRSRGGEKTELLVQNGLPEPTERQKQGGKAALSAARCVPSSETIVFLSKNRCLVMYFCPDKLSQLPERFS